MAEAVTGPMGARQVQVTVRPRTDADLDRCAAILVRVHGVDGYPVEGVADPHARLHPDGLVAARVARSRARTPLPAWAGPLPAWAGATLTAALARATPSTGQPALTDPSIGDRGEVGRLAPGLEDEPFGQRALFVAPEARGWVPAAGSSKLRWRMRGCGDFRSSSTSW